MAVFLPISAFFLVKFHTMATQKNKNKNKNKNRNSFAKCTTKGFFLKGGKNAQNSPYLYRVL